MQRINWIDWAKAWCMTVVVFDHTPHDSSPFLLQYLAATNLSTFFFISGYLKKPVSSQNEAIKKYTYCLLIPYLIYNAIYYPYWICKSYIQHGGFPSLSDCLKPIIGTLLGQLDSSISCHLNGVTWFLISLFIMHVITDFCNRRKNRKTWMLFISIIALLLYGLNKYTYFAPYLTFHGLVRCICFFFMGFIVRQANIPKAVSLRRDFILGISSLIISLVLFYWHITENVFSIHITLFFILNFFSVTAIIHLCRCLNCLKTKLVLYISLGTMMIFGLHRIIIGIIDYAVEKLFTVPDTTYSYHQAISITLLIEFIIIPLVIISANHYPLLLGKRTKN